MLRFPLSLIKGREGGFVIHFFSDLDNTLIYSHRRALFENKILVEKLNDREQSFMTSLSYDFFSIQSNVNLIPVTTRTIKQYKRLSAIMEKFNCYRALVCNGGVLLEYGEINQPWLEETKELIEPEREEMIKAEELIKSMCPEAILHNEEGILIYAKVAEPQIIVSNLCEMLDISKVNVFSDDRKVYCTPYLNSKGNAVKRYSKKYGCVVDVAAGDSVVDLTMLSMAKKSIAPESIKKFTSCKQIKFCPQELLLSDFICLELSKNCT